MTRTKYKGEMSKVSKQSKLAGAKFEELQMVGEGKWESMVTEIGNFRDAFKLSFNYFKSQL